MTYLTNKIQTAIRFLNKPVTRLSQSDIDAVKMLLEDINAELAPKYRLEYTIGGRKFYVAKQPRHTDDKPDLALVNEKSIAVYDNEDLEFTGDEVAGYPKTWNVFDWKNIDVKPVGDDDEV